MLLKVEGIYHHIGKDKLNELFSKIGIVESITIIRDIYSGRSRGFASWKCRVKPKVRKPSDS